jgi:hypothetical protein
MDIIDLLGTRILRPGAESLINLPDLSERQQDARQEKVRFDKLRPRSDPHQEG